MMLKLKICIRIRFCFSYRIRIVKIDRISQLLFVPYSPYSQFFRVKYSKMNLNEKRLFAKNIDPVPGTGNY
jgi:hypothetical protein